VLFFVTFITSIGALALFQPVLDDPVGYIAGGERTARSICVVASAVRGLTSTSGGHDFPGGSGIGPGFAAEGELDLVGRRGSSGE